MSQPDNFSLDSYVLIVLNWSVLLESLAGQSKSCSWQTRLCRAASPAVRTHHCGPSTQLECTCQCQGKKVLTYVRMVLETPPIWLYSDFFNFIVTTDENLTLWHWNIKMVQWNHNYETSVDRVKLWCTHASVQWWHFLSHCLADRDLIEEAKRTVYDYMVT